VDGCNNAIDIANSFATHFEQACQPNSADYNQKLKVRFEEKFRSYQPSSKLQWISVETVEKCIGVDGIEASKHLHYAYSRICVILALLLFNAMLIHGVVLSMFGAGIIILLIIGHNIDGSSSDNYRGITISVHISKVSEMCILEIYGNYFVISDLQFGFKKRVDCKHALYAGQSVVRHFTNGNSTVYLCALDVLKAFDRVNHFAEAFCDVIRLQCGVRQGGVLLPVVFTVYVNDVIMALPASGYGCYFHGISGFVLVPCVRLSRLLPAFDCTLTSHSYLRSSAVVPIIV